MQRTISTSAITTTLVYIMDCISAQDPTKKETAGDSVTCQTQVVISNAVFEHTTHHPHHTHRYHHQHPAIAETGIVRKSQQKLRSFCSEGKKLWLGKATHWATRWHLSLALSPPGFWLPWWISPCALPAPGASLQLMGVAVDMR